MVSISSLENCKKLKFFFKYSEHSFLISRSLQNHFLISFLWQTLNSNDFEGSVLLSQKTFSTSSHKNLQKTEKYSFQTLRTFVFELKVASKPFSKKTNSFPENDFNFVNQKFAKNRKLLRKWFWSFLELKNKYCGRLKIAFFYHFWESEARCSKLFKFKVGHRMHFRKWLWSYLELKTDCSECLKRGFFSFLQILSDEVETIFRETEARNQKLLKSKFGHRKLIRKLFCSSLELKNECSEPLKKTLLSFCEVLGDEVETTSWKSDANRQKLFKLKFGYKKLLRKWFWS